MPKIKKNSGRKEAPVRILFSKTENHFGKGRWMR